ARHVGRRIVRRRGRPSRDPEVEDLEDKRAEDVGRDVGERPARPEQRADSAGRDGGGGQNGDQESSSLLSHLHPADPGAPPGARSLTRPGRRTGKRSRESEPGERAGAVSARPDRARRWNKEGASGLLPKARRLLARRRVILGVAGQLKPNL